METLQATFSAEAYFETQPPPSTIDQDVQSVREFLNQQQAHRRKVVLVTVRIPILYSQRNSCPEFHLVCRRAEEQPFLWNSMCELLRAQRSVPG